MTVADESLPALLRRTQQEAARAGHAVRLIDEPAFTVLVAGPVDTGKTMIVRTLLGDGAPLGEAALGPRPGFSTTVPVEYVYGQPALWLGVGGSALAPEQWWVARPEDPDLMWLPGLRRVRVATPASVLRDWDVRIVDHPGIDAPGDPVGLLVEAVRHPDTGVLYTVPSRGVSDADAYALEALRAAPVVVVGSLREAELTADQSAVYEIEVPWMTAGVALPILVSRLAGPGPERDALRDCVDLLRSVNRPASWRAGVLDACVRSRRHLRQEYTAAFERALSHRRHDPLRTLAELLRLDTRGRIDKHLEERFSRSAQRAGAERGVAELRAVVEEAAHKAVNAYNVQAVRVTPPRSAPAATGTTEPVQLGQAYQQVRSDLIDALGTIAADGPLRLTKGDREVLAKVVEAITADRLEVAVLGPFSAGKSTLINALLNADVLPTGAGPKTAAVTRLVYGTKPMVTATWRDRIELTLLSESRIEGALRVHVEELTALAEWLDTGEVSSQDCTFELLGPGTASDAAQLDGLRRLWSALTQAARGKLPDFIYTGDQHPRLPRGAVPARVVVRRFARNRDWPGELSIRDALGQASDKNSPLTLRLKEIHVAHPHPLLHHVAIIDTPGTDAPVPHHKQMAYSAVRDKPQCAVVYCFMGFKPAGSADDENLAFLKEAKVGSSELSRFFFTITQQGRVQPPTEWPRVQKIVVDALRDLGIDRGRRTYFVEVMHERNQDFVDLLNDLNQFVTQHKGSLVVSWIEQGQKVVAGVRDRHQARLDVLERGEQARLQRARLLAAEAAEVAELAEEMRTSKEWGEPYLRRRLAIARAAAASDIDTEIRALTTEAEFAEITGFLESSLEELNEWAQKAVRKACEGAISGLRAELGTRLPGRTISDPVIPPGDVFFPATAILQAAKAVRWRSRWEKVKDWWGSDDPGWDSDVANNRGRIKTAWRTVRDAGELRLAGARATIGAQLSAEIDRIGDSIAHEIGDIERPPSPHDERVAREGLKRCKDWAHRLGALAESATGGTP